MPSPEKDRNFIKKKTSLIKKNNKIRRKNIAACCTFIKKRSNRIAFTDVSKNASLLVHWNERKKERKKQN